MEIAFTVMGNCVAQGRPRTAIIAGHAVVYDPTKSRDYKQYLKLAASKEMGDDPLMERPASLQVTVWLPIPKSFSKKKTADALAGTVLPAKKPDVDNFYKTISDALNGVVYRDDSQICMLSVYKLYGEKPMIKVLVKEL